VLFVVVDIWRNNPIVSLLFTDFGVHLFPTLDRGSRGRFFMPLVRSVSNYETYSS
jgi:hypothetical protein